MGCCSSQSFVEAVYGALPLNPMLCNTSEMRDVIRFRNRKRIAGIAQHEWDYRCLYIYIYYIYIYTVDVSRFHIPPTQAGVTTRMITFFVWDPNLNLYLPRLHHIVSPGVSGSNLLELGVFRCSCCWEW